MVSIVIPVYNAEKYLERCVQSIMSQTYRDIEIILIDDGSMDNSPALCDALAAKDLRIRVIHQKNMGVCAARNRGIEVASGGKLMFVDADDWLDTSTVETMVSIVDTAHADLGICAFRNIYKDKGEFAYEISSLNETTQQFISKLSGYVGVDAILCSVCNKIYNLKAVKDNVRFATGIKFGEDFIFNAQYLVHSRRIVSVNKALYFYDCSVEGSGVKKWYSDYPQYINAMEYALAALLDQYGIANDEFANSFIGDRWNYAVTNCIHCSFENKESTLTNLVNAIPDRYWNYEKMHSGDMGYIYNMKLGQIDAKKALSSIRTAQKKRNAVTGIKRLLKKVMQ